MKKFLVFFTVLLVMAVTSIAQGEDDDFITLSQIKKRIKEWEPFNQLLFPTPEAPLVKVIKIKNPKDKKEKGFLMSVCNNPNEYYIHSFHVLNGKGKKSFLISYYPTETPGIYYKFRFFERSKNESCGKCHIVPTTPDPEPEKKEIPIKPVPPPSTGQYLSGICSDLHLERRR